MTIENLKNHIKIKLSPDLVGDLNFTLPRRATPGSAGLDLMAAEDAVLASTASLIHPPTMVRLGIHLEIPEGYYVSFVPRSSLGKKGILIPNSPATIDSDYRLECKLLLLNTSTSTVYIKKYDRIAQMIIHKIEDLPIVFAEELSSSGERTGGFGSTGT